MDTAPAQEHPKRPRSAATDKNDPYQNNPRRKFRRRATDSLSDFKDNRSEDGSGSSMSESEEHELGPVGSDADIDEESGLTGKERQKHLHRKKRQHALGARIAGAGVSANDEQREADKSVMKRILFNTFLILMWYIFSLSISLVSPSSTYSVAGTHVYSTTNGCSQATTSTSISRYSRRPSI